MEETMLEKIEDRLEAWGYTSGESDSTAIEFLINKTENYIRNFCNIEEIPESLIEAEIDMICLDFLKSKALYGGLDTTGIQIESIASITEGDASVSYNGGSSSTLSKMYDETRARFEADMMPFRRLRW